MAIHSQFKLPNSLSERGFWGVIFSAITLFTVGLGNSRLWDRDETRNAQCAAEMLARTDFVIPTFDGALRPHKPPLLYWAQIGFYKLFGVSEWSARLPSALSGVLTVCLAYFIALQLMGPAVAKWTGFVTATSTLLIIAARAATPDSLLIACSTLAMYFFVSGAQSAVQVSTGERTAYFVSPNARYWLLIYVAGGLGVLAKGPIGVLLPCSVIWLCLVVSDNGAVWRRGQIAKAVACSWRAVWSMRPFLGLLVIGAICGPWYLAVGIATDGVWLREFFMTQHLGRATRVMEGHSGPPLIFYLVALVVGTFPWSIWIFTSWLHAKHAWKWDPETRPTILLAVSWMAVYVGFFSFSATKLPSYITPCLPGAALLFGLMLSGWADADRRRWRIGSHPLLGWGQIGALLGILIGGSIMVVAANFRIDEESFVAVTPLGLLFGITSTFALLAMRLERPAASVRVFAIGSLGLMFGVSVLVPTILDRSRGDLNYLMSQSEHMGSRIGYVGESEPSWVFYGGGLTRIAKSDWQQSAWEFLRSGPNHVLLLDALQLDQLRDFVRSTGALHSAELLRVSEPIHSGMHDRVVYRIQIDARTNRERLCDVESAGREIRQSSRR